MVSGYGRGGNVEAAPIQGGERRRRPSDIRFRAEAGGPDWAGLGRAGRVATRPIVLFGLKMREKRKMGCRTIFFQFLKQRFDFKSQGFKYF
jgi:hypothetical protein